MRLLWASAATGSPLGAPATAAMLDACLELLPGMNTGSMVLLLHCLTKLVVKEKPLLLVNLLVKELLVRRLQLTEQQVQEVGKCCEALGLRTADLGWKG